MMAALSASLPVAGVLLVLAPWAEEVVFRLGLQENLLRRWPGHALAAIVVTALVFGLAHALLRQDPMALAVAAPALLLGLLYGRWRLLWPCVALHAAMNALWLFWLRDALPPWLGW